MPVKWGQLQVQYCCLLQAAPRFGIEPRLFVDLDKPINNFNHAVARSLVDLDQSIVNLLKATRRNRQQSEGVFSVKQSQVQWRHGGLLVFGARCTAVFV